MKSMFRPLWAFLFVIVVGGSFVAVAQQKPSEAAYLQWKAERQKKQVSLQGGHIGVGLSVSRYQNIGVQVEFSVFSEASEITAPDLQFRAQPLAYIKNDNGKNDLVDVGSPTTLTFKGSSNFTRNEIGLIAQPEMIGRVPSETKAVRVTISVPGEGNSQISVIMPLADSTFTSVVSKNAACNRTDGSSSACSWWQGSCPGQCVPATMCVACNNDSPTLNCVSCSMGCSGSGPGSNCTPDVEAPDGCPAVRPAGN